jgi:hypothetical protein
MKEMNLIGRSQADFPLTGSPAMLTAQNSRGNAPTVGAVQTINALPLHSAAEHNPPGAGERFESKVENLIAFQSSGKTKCEKVTSLSGYLRVMGKFKKQLSGMKQTREPPVFDIY